MHYGMHYGMHYVMQALLRNAPWLREAQVQPPTDAAQLLQQLPTADCVAAANWPEALRCVGWLLPAMHSEPQACLTCAHVHAHVHVACGMWHTACGMQHVACLAYCDARCTCSRVLVVARHREAMYNVKCTMCM